MRYTATQPLFFPPLYMVARYLGCQRVYLMGSAQFNRGTTQHRTTLKGRSGPFRFSVRLANAGRRPINDHRFVGLKEDLLKLRSLMHVEYRGAPYLDAVDRLFDGAIAAAEDRPGMSLSEFNQGVLREILVQLVAQEACGRPVILDAGRKEDYSDAANPSEWLARLPGDRRPATYIAGGPALDNYLDLDLFRRLGVEVEKQDFTLTGYDTAWGPQNDATVSVLDALAWIGPRDTFLALTA